MRKTFRGITVIELLVVVAIIGVLIGLLLPAVQAARESARKFQCSGHIKELSLGVLNFESSHGSFPSGGWGTNWIGLPDRGGGQMQPAGWIYQILPQIEQPQLFQLGGDSASDFAANAKRIQTPLSLLFCPSRRSASVMPSGYGWETPLAPGVTQFARNDYAMNGGSIFVAYGVGPPSIAAAESFHWPSMSRCNGLVHQRSKVTVAQVTDGLSNTFLIGEKHIPTENYLNGLDPGDNECAYGGDDRDLVRFTGMTGVDELLPMTDLWNKPSTREQRGVRFGSAHATGFHISMADGSVHFVGYAIDSAVHRSLGNRNDGENVLLP